MDTRIRPLREEERQDAYEQARLWVAGRVPEKKMFKNYGISRYPPSILALVSGLCLLLLVAAFVPSAFRLHESGQTEFCQTLGGVAGFVDDPRCGLVGLATVLLAETGSLVFLFALAVVTSSHPVTIGRHQVDLVPLLLWSGAGLSTTIAIIGNAHIGRPWEYGHHAFDYLITFGPPLLVMGVGFILKDIFLLSVESRHASQKAFQEALMVYQASLQDPESSPKWLRFYSRALKEAIQKANRRQSETLSTYGPSDWEALIRRELKAESWFVTESSREEAAQEFREGKKPETQVEDGEVWINPDKTWSARSFILNQVIGAQYKSEGFARLALKNKHRSLEKKVSQNGKVPH